MQTNSSCYRRIIFSLLLSLSALFGACASTNGPANPKDPLEGYNRAMFGFNTAVDNAVTKPLAKGYVAVVPELFRNMIGNVFANIDDLFIGVNNLLQGKPKQAFSDWGRLLVNTTIGFAGIADVASDLGMEKHNEDFGQTLGKWGAGPGPYLVLPFLGPSNFRDGTGNVGDILTNPTRKLKPARDKNRVFAVRLLDTRAGLLSADKLADSASLDKYSLVRDAYLARRRSLVYDGDPPEEKSEASESADDSKGAENKSAEKKDP